MGPGRHHDLHAKRKGSNLQKREGFFFPVLKKDEKYNQRQCLFSCAHPSIHSVYNILPLTSFSLVPSFCLQGAHPFSGLGQAQIKRKLVKEKTPPAIPEHASHLLRSLLEWMLEIDPCQRPSIATVVKKLKKLRASASAIPRAQGVLGGDPANVSQGKDILLSIFYYLFCHNHNLSYRLILD